jgi:TRAP-type C4-dicarboxylate transport system substrate-binding protein
MYNPVGPVMNFSSERELTGVDAMKGLKARRLLKTDEPMWDALKANRISLPTGEVYTGTTNWNDKYNEYSSRKYRSL